MRYVQFISVVVCSIIIAACQSKGDSTAAVTYTDTIPANTEEWTGATLSVEDASMYSTIFLDGFKNNYGYSQIALMDSLILLDNQDSIYFPSQPLLGKPMQLKGKKGNIEVNLSFTRLNYSTLEYALQIAEKGKATQQQKGRADLNPSFILGAEFDQHETTGEEYMVAEFSHQLSDTCFCFIRLGSAEGKSNQILGRVSNNCNGSIGEVNMDNTPMLK